MGILRVDTAAILQAADAFQQLHIRAEKAVDNAQQSIKSLDWDSPAGEQMQQAYAAFHDKYFERYLQMLQNYQLFLRETAAGGYEQTEQGNVELSDLIDESVGVYIKKKAEGLGSASTKVVSDWAAQLK